jgi:predicted small lipoprotein YifL
LKSKSLVLIVGLCLSCLAGCSRSGSKSAPVANASSPSDHADQTSRPSTDSASSTTGGNDQSAPANAGDEIKDQLHTPAKGSDERQGIMDALRAEFDNRQSPFYTAHRGTIVFVVNRLQVHNGWAWMNGYPHSSDAGDSFGEYNGFLLHLQGGQWGVMRLPPMVNDPDDPENLDYPSRRDVERIRQKYPTAPIDIFSK